MVVLPAAVTTIFLSIILTIYLTIKTLNDIRKELLSLNSVNFQFKDVFEINIYVIQNFLLKLLSNKVFLITALFLILLWFYIVFSRKKMLYNEDMKFNFVIYVLSYGFLFAFWWIVSFVYVLFNKKVVWREEKNE